MPVRTRRQLAVVQPSASTRTPRQARKRARAPPDHADGVALSLAESAVNSGQTQLQRPSRHEEQSIEATAVSSGLSITLVDHAAAAGTAADVAAAAVPAAAACSASVLLDWDEDTNEAAYDQAVIMGMSPRRRPFGSLATLNHQQSEASPFAAAAAAGAVCLDTATHTQTHFDTDNEDDNASEDEAATVEDTEPSSAQHDKRPKMSERDSRALWLCTVKALEHVEQTERYIFDDKRRSRVIRDTYWRIVKNAAIFSQRTGVEVFLAAGRPTIGQNGMKQHIFASAGLCNPENQCLHQAVNEMTTTWTSSLNKYREALIKRNKEKDDLIHRQQTQFLADQRRIKDQEEELERQRAAMSNLLEEMNALRQQPSEAAGSSLPASGSSASMF